jgi:hypothetical protein
MDEVAVIEAPAIDLAMSVFSTVRFVIPSRHRVDRLLTLTTLHRLGVDASKVAVVVADDEIDLYSRALYGMGVWVCPGRIGLGANRNAAMTKWSPGTPVVMLDDDLRYMRTMDEDTGKWRDMTYEEFAIMCLDGFSSLHRWKALVWGVCHVHNDLWARKLPKVQVGMVPLEGCLQGFFSYENSALLVPEDTRIFEDITRCAQVYAAGYNLVRMNRYTYWQSESKKGGKSQRSNSCAEVRRLEQQYPGIIEHSVGFSTVSSTCRPWPKRGLCVADPESLEQVEALRSKTRGISMSLIPPVIHP